MTSSATLILYLLLPLLAWITCQKFASTKKRMVLLIFATVIAGSCLYLVSVRTVGIEHQQDLKRYDLDHDGGFSELEYTPAARAAMKRFANDTGSSLAPIAAPLATTFWVLSVFGICFLVKLGLTDIRVHRAKSRAEHAAPSDGDSPQLELGLSTSRTRIEEAEQDAPSNGG